MRFDAPALMGATQQHTSVDAAAVRTSNTWAAACKALEKLLYIQPLTLVEGVETRDASGASSVERVVEKRLVVFSKQRAAAAWPQRGAAACEEHTARAACCMRVRRRRGGGRGRGGEQQGREERMSTRHCSWRL